MKRTLAVVLAIAAATGIVAACVGDDPTPAPLTSDGGPVPPPAPPPPGTDGSATDSGDAALPGATTIASDQPFPVAIAVLGSVVYWVNEGGNVDGCTDTADGTIMSAPTDGSAAPKTVANGLHCPGSLAVTATKVYWGERGTPSINYADGKIGVAGHDGSNPAAVVTGIQFPIWIHADDASVWYFTGPANGIDALWRTKPDGGGPVRLTPVAKSAAGMAIDSNVLYWTEDFAGHVYKIPADDDGGADGGTKTKLADDTHLPNQPIVLNGAVYWLGKAAGCSIGMWTAAAGQSQLVPDLGIPREPANQNTAGCRQIATDGQYFYVTAMTDKLVRVPVAGGAPTRLEVPDTTAIGVGADGSVYVGTGAGAAKILKLPK